MSGGGCIVAGDGVGGVAAGASGFVSCVVDFRDAECLFVGNCRWYPGASCDRIVGVVGRCSISQLMFFTRCLVMESVFG